MIARLVAGARVGQSGALVLLGEAGIGKTALLQRAAALGHDMCVLRGDGRESERDVAFAGLHQLLRPVMHLAQTLPAPQREALEVALALRAPRDAGGRDTRFAVGAATLTLLAHAAEEVPLLLLVDDAHLWDRASSAALAFVVRRLVVDRLCLVIASRPDPDSPLLDAGLPSVQLAGLGLDVVPALLAHHGKPSVEADLARRLHQATAGNPLGLIELADDLESIRRLAPHTQVPVPAALVEGFTRRAAGLSTATQSMLLVAAVAGEELALVERAAGILTIGGVEDLGAAEHAGLVRLSPGRVDFRHPLARAGVYGAATPGRRREVHRAVASALATDDVERRTWNLCEATVGTSATVAADLAHVGARARERYAHADAATAYERAALLSPRRPDRARRLLDAGGAAWLAGQPQRADDLLAQAAASADDGPLLATIDGLRGTIALRAGAMDSALRILNRAAERLALADPDAAVLLLGDAVTACFYLADARGAADVGARIDALLEHCTTTRARLSGELMAGIAEILGGLGGTDRIRRAVAELVELPDLEEDQWRPAWMVLGPLFLRESETGRALVEHAVDELRRRCALATLPNLLFHTARDAATSDRWDDAVVAYAEGIDLAREGGQNSDLTMNLAGLAWLQARTGDAQACRQHAAEALALAERHEVRLGALWATYALAEVELAHGRAEESLVHLDELEHRLDALGFRDVDLAPGPERAEVLAHLGRLEEARAAAVAYHVRALAKAQPWALARAERALGVVGDPRHFDRALELHRLSPDLFESSRTRLAYGAALRRDRHRLAARPLLRESLAGFEQLGSRPWVDRAARELDATGEKVARQGADPLDSLTPQERQIARLLGSGRTNREAAAALFLSPKTVEYHLRHVYTKLSIRSRAELASTLDAHRAARTDDVPGSR